MMKEEMYLEAIASERDTIRGLKAINAELQSEIATLKQVVLQIGVRHSICRVCNRTIQKGHADDCLFALLTNEAIRKAQP